MSTYWVFVSFIKAEHNEELEHKAIENRRTLERPWGFKLETCRDKKRWCERGKKTVIDERMSLSRELASKSNQSDNCSSGRLAAWQISSIHKENTLPLSIKHDETAYLEHTNGWRAMDKEDTRLHNLLCLQKIVKNMDFTTFFLAPPTKWSAFERS